MRSFQNSLAIAAIILLLLGVVMLANLAGDGVAIAFWGLLLLGGMLLAADVGKPRWQAWRIERVVRAREQQVRDWLGNRSWADALAQAPYNYARWPDGDSCWVIQDERSSKLVTSELSPRMAELWILERMMAEAHREEIGENADVNKDEQSEER